PMWWAWLDTSNQIHVLTLSDGRPMFNSQPHEGLQKAAFQPRPSPDGRFLLVPRTSAGPIDVWDVATGRRDMGLEQMTGNMLSWDFGKADRLCIACRNAAEQSARILVYRLP